MAIKQLDPRVIDYSKPLRISSLFVNDLTVFNGLSSVVTTVNTTEVSSLNVTGILLSSGVNLLDIIKNSEVDAQTLSFSENLARITITNGNTISLSSIDVRPLSANWQSTCTNVQSNSAYWQTGYNIGTTYTTASSSFMRRYATNIGNGSLTAFTVTHNLGTRDVITSVYDNTTYENIITSVANTTTNTVSLSFSTAPGSNAYRVVVIG